MNIEIPITPLIVILAILFVFSFVTTLALGWAYLRKQLSRRVMLWKMRHRYRPDPPSRDFQFDE